MSPTGDRPSSARQVPPLSCTQAPHWEMSRWVVGCGKEGGKEGRKEGVHTRLNLCVQMGWEVVIQILELDLFPSHPDCNICLSA